MSTEEDPELRDLIAKCLENNGVLGKLRAQLRASTFLALDHQDDPKVSFPLSNSAVQQFASSTHGALTMSLIREFFTYFNMEFSLSVFDPETSEGITYNSISRSNLASLLGLNAGVEEPLLHALVLKLNKEKIPDEPTQIKPQNLDTDLKLGQEKLGNLKVNGDDYDEDFQSSSASAISKNEVKEQSVDEDLDESASDLLASQSSNVENDTVDKSTSNSALSTADHVETL